MTAALLSTLFPAMSLGADVVSMKRLGLDFANELAQAAVADCRERGYQVTAVIVDRGSDVQVVLRDTLAAPQTIQLARDKANAVILSATDSSVLQRNRQDIRMELDHVEDLLVLAGGVQITAGGSWVGALGVSGAPGGDIDEACAKAALEKYQERLEFAD
jgi:uncharacterized protein GlcG (DUF336 family)